MTTGKVELAKTISQKTGITQKQASEFINTFVETVEENWEKTAGGFGTFMTRKREKREGRKPGTGEIIEIPASIAPVFKAGKSLKEKLNS